MLKVEVTGKSTNGEKISPMTAEFIVVRQGDDEEV